MQHVFGPVPSRRLSYSLGVDIIPPKYCSYNCVYCQIGRTTQVEIIRKSFYDPEVIIGQVLDRISRQVRMDVITFSGSGEPTLNLDLGFMIRALKEKTSVPVAVITNGSTLCDVSVREDLKAADIILPSLDAITQDIFDIINRPHPGLDIHAIIDGLRAFRNEYEGQIWLEIMLIKNINDDLHYLNKMAEIVLSLKMDRIQLNTVTRPPSESSASRLSENELNHICAIFGPRCEVISSFEKKEEYIDEASASFIVETLRRRPLTLDDIVKTTGLSALDVKLRLSMLETEGRISMYVLDNELFYVSS